MNKVFDPIDIFFIVIILVYFVCLISFIVIFVQKYYDFAKPKDDTIEKVKTIDKKSIKSFILSKKDDNKKDNKTKSTTKNKSPKKDNKVPTQMKKVPKKNTNTKKKRPNKTQSKKNVKRNYKSNVSYVRNNPKRKGTSK